MPHGAGPVRGAQEQARTLGLRLLSLPSGQAYGTAADSTGRPGHVSLDGSGRIPRPWLDAPGERTRIPRRSRRSLPRTTLRSIKPARCPAALPATPPYGRNEAGPGVSVWLPVARRRVPSGCLPTPRPLGSATRRRDVGGSSLTAAAVASRRPRMTQARHRRASRAVGLLQSSAEAHRDPAPSTSPDVDRQDIDQHR
jgi:hypothetical protein